MTDTPDTSRATLRTLAARVVDLEAENARLREATLREAAAIARDGCLVPPDGGSPTDAEISLCDEIARRIIARIDTACAAPTMTMSDTPDTSRAALEAARYYEEWARDIRRHSGKSVDADYADATAAILRTLAARVVELEARMARLQALTAEQAEDEGLWFLARTCPEAYLQQELRRLHAAIEAVTLADGTDD